MAKKLHYQAVDQTEPPCGIKKIATTEHFEYITTTDPNQVGCRVCDIWLREQGLKQAAQQQPTGDMDLQFLVGLPIDKAFAALHVNHRNRLHFIQLVSEDGERYFNAPKSARTDRVLLEAVDNLIVKAYIG